ncbi:hypothetical protein [Methanofollis tationis]|uniref:Uncharacterized protein n=1 Tax=Methanofollis tationis TaxID=81417 RepID=A0A7K4HML6_9EURY|nr:hypothetical protein [Methanofollis tationis]NVO66515.1 hypothetical protein [Methanofollis tationis]
MRDSEKTFVTPEDERIYRMEQRMKDMDALVKGLTEEVLDLKTITMKLYRAFEARAEAEKAARAKVVVVEPPATPAPEPVQRTAPQRQKVAPAPVPAPVEEDDADMDLIMQSDGTLKRERREKSSYIIAPTKYQAPAGLMSEGRKGSRRSSEKKSGGIIYAEDDDDTITK